MKFTEVKDKARLAAPGKVRVVKYLGSEANGRVHVYHAESIDENGDVVEEGTLKAFNIPPSQLEVQDDQGTLGDGYRLSNDKKWIIEADRGAGLRNFEGMHRKEA